MPLIYLPLSHLFRTENLSEVVEGLEDVEVLEVLKVLEVVGEGVVEVVVEAVVVVAGARARRGWAVSDYRLANSGGKD